MMTAARDCPADASQDSLPWLPVELQRRFRAPNPIPQSARALQAVPMVSTQDYPTAFWYERTGNGYAVRQPDALWIKARIENGDTNAPAATVSGRCHLEALSTFGLLMPPPPLQCPSPKPPSKHFIHQMIDSVAVALKHQKADRRRWLGLTTEVQPVQATLPDGVNTRLQYQRGLRYPSPLR